MLKTIHDRFFNEFERNCRETVNLPNVKEILLSVKGEIFSDCCFVFSGLLHQRSSFEEQEIWKLAREFGADCEYEIDDRTTHLISSRIDTEKALESKERGIPAVRPEWIYESCKKWGRLPCDAFELEISGKRRKAMKRSAADLEESESDCEVDSKEIIYNGEPILDEEDLEEIQRELADLDDSSEDGSAHGSDTEDYEDAELSDGDFSDLLKYSSNDDCGDTENSTDNETVAEE